MKVSSVKMKAIRECSKPTSKFCGLLKSVNECALYDMLKASSALSMALVMSTMASRYAPVVMAASLAMRYCRQALSGRPLRRCCPASCVASD